MTEVPRLAGRKAKCTRCGSLADSANPSLAFFEYRGEGSKAAASCACGYFKEAHERDEKRVHPEPIKCRVGGFRERGAMEYDGFYCGCGGWD